MTVMKKYVLIILVLISVMAVACSLAETKDDKLLGKAFTFEIPGNDKIPEFNLPESVEIIEEEAFEGTSIVKVSLPYKVSEIGERAFANIKTLCSIQIPTTTKKIASTAFAGSKQVTINAATDSYARTWAKENGVPFSPITVLYAGIGSQSVTASLSSISKEVLDTESPNTKDTHRTWRKLEEIQVHDTIEIIANVIQGRAPPMA